MLGKHDALQESPQACQTAQFPSNHQNHTSEDGLWIAINVPAGKWTVEAYVSDGNGGHLLMGAKEMQVLEDSFSISHIDVGFGDWPKLPEACLER